MNVAGLLLLGSMLVSGGQPKPPAKGDYLMTIVGKNPQGHLIIQPMIPYQLGVQQTAGEEPKPREFFRCSMSKRVAGDILFTDGGRGKLEAIHLTCQVESGFPVEFDIDSLVEPVKP
jgi:hypothetical protein